MHIYTIWLRDNNNIYEGRDLVIQRMHYYRHTILTLVCDDCAYSTSLLLCDTFTCVPHVFRRSDSIISKWFFLCIKWMMSVKKIKCLQDYPTLEWNIRIKTTFENILDINFFYSACVQFFTLPHKIAEIQIQE